MIKTVMLGCHYEQFVEHIRNGLSASLVGYVKIEAHAITLSMWSYTRQGAVVDTETFPSDITLERCVNNDELFTIESANVVVFVKKSDLVSAINLLPEGPMTTAIALALSDEETTDEIG